MLKVLQAVPNVSLDHEEYYGSTKLSQIDGRGRGLVATKNIYPGELVLANRALAIVNPDPTSQTSSPLLAKVKRFRLLKESVADVVKVSPDHAKKLYHLHAGPKLGFLEPHETENMHKNNPVDIKRIEGICIVNGFESQSGSNFREGEGSCGLWYLASFLNHDCTDANANWAIYNDFIFVRAVKLIRSGEEILISYIDPHKPYSVRKDFFLKHDFVCLCQLCKLEAKEDRNIRNLKENLLADFNDKDFNQNDVQKIRSFIDQMEQLTCSSGGTSGSGSKEDNLRRTCYLQPLMHLGLVHYERREFEEACHVFNKAFDICRTFAPLNPASIFLATAMARSYLKLKRHEMVTEWILEIMKSISWQYGVDQSYEILGFLQPDFVKEMSSEGVQVKKIFADVSNNSFVHNLTIL
jgi:tetratricopeptide (TPR) repeat protein